MNRFNQMMVFASVVTMGSLPAAIAQSGGGYTIVKSTINSGGATVNGGSYRLSGTVGQHDAGNIAGGDYYVTGGFWSPAAAVPVPMTPAADPTGIDKVRFISFLVPPPTTAGIPAAITALRVHLDSMHLVNPPYTGAPGAPPFTDCEGKVRWAGPPSVYIESQSAGTRFFAAPTQSTPYYRDWSQLASCTDNAAPFEYGAHFNPQMPLKLCNNNAECVVGRCRVGADPPSSSACYSDADCPAGTGTCQDIVQAGELCLIFVDPLIHLTGSAIVPSSRYTVESVDVSCTGNEVGCAAVSGGLEVSTQRWGDVVATFQLPCGPSHPNPACQDAGTCTGTNCTTQADASDFGSLVSKFKSQLGSPIKARGLLAGAGAPGIIDIVPDLGFQHIAAGVAAFQGKAYPYTPECMTTP